jgi:hypothetical protein
MVSRLQQLKATLLYRGGRELRAGMQIRERVKHASISILDIDGLKVSEKRPRQQPSVALTG